MSNEFSENRGDKWVSCDICGPGYLYARLRFTSGSVEPTLGETLTGADSGATGVVNRVHLESGSYADGDATGEVLLVDVTGFNLRQWECFYAEEQINGSTGGVDMMTAEADHNGILSRQGRIYPERETVLYKGKRYCLSHYHQMVPKRQLDETKVDITEGDREDGF